MGIRRVVTGHAADGVSVIVSDDEVAPIKIGDHGSGAAMIWGRDEPGRFPDDGTMPPVAGAFPPPGGCGLAVMELAPHGDEFHTFVGSALAPWADPDEPGMHRTATL